MSTQTTNLKLNKPDIGDTPGVTIPQLASNFDILDASLAEIALDVKSAQFGAKGDGVTDDTAAIQAAINAGNIVLLPAGTYKITSQLLLKSNTVLYGAGRYITKLTWAGVSGGVAIGTSALTSSSSDFVGSLRDFQVFYPYSLLTASSVGLYVAMPSGEINGVFVCTDNQGDAGHPPVTGSKGIDLDGCANASPPKVYALVAGQFGTGISVRANHVSLIAPSTAYNNHGIKIDQDSIASPQSPPYNVNILGAHGYAHGTAFIDAVRGQSIYVFGGFNESGSGIYNIQTESTFNGFVKVDGVSTTNGSRLNRLGGTVHYMNIQDNVNEVYTPSGNNNTVQRRFEAEASYNSIGTTEVVIAAINRNIAGGASGNITMKFLGNATVNTAGATVTFNVYKDTAQGTAGSAPNGTGSGAGGFTTSIANANNAMAAVARHILTNMNTAQYFYITAKVSTGTATVYGVLEVESY